MLSSQSGPLPAPTPEPVPCPAAAGLSQREAARRLLQYGPNQWRVEAQAALLWQYLGRFRNPLIMVLLAASAVSAYLREVTNVIIIMLMVLLGVTLDFVLEWRANAAAARLRASVSARATVVRDSHASAIPVADVVPGDVVQVAAGDMIPADGSVLSAEHFFVNQAAMTGESFPVSRQPPPAGAADVPDHAASSVLMGTSVVSGSARILVRRTGAATAIGQMGEALAARPPPTSFEIGTQQFGMLVMRLTILMLLFVLMVNTLAGKPPLESLLFAVALAVGLTPEMLPMIVSVTLARGALSMAQQHVIIKRMTAVQDLGSMDVLCADKTGTLTEARIVLERHVDSAGRDSERVLALAYLNSIFESGLKSPLDEAILAHQHIATGAWRKIDELPFDFERRRVSVLVDNGSERWLVLKGAPDEVLALCAEYETGEADEAGRAALDGAALAQRRQQVRALEQAGLRVLAIAWRAVAADCVRAEAADEAGLVLAGFPAFLDPPRPGAGAALASLQGLGVAIKIVTGDSEHVTRHLCQQLQLDVTGILTGQQVAGMDDLALRALVGRTNLFCRISPADKNRIILALKARGHVVGYLGDGINDAPALHSADVGLSVDSAVDVARDAADILLLKPDLQVLQRAVLEGRRTFGNIMKYIMMVSSSNFGNMFSMAGAALFMPFLPMLPTQILLNNILYDLSEIPIPMDRIDADEAQRPRVLNLPMIRNFMLVIGTVSSVFDFLTFYVLLSILHAGERLFQTGWFVESLCTQVLVIFLIRTRGSPLHSRPHPILAATAVLVACVAIGLPFTPLGASFSLVPLPTIFFAYLAAMVIGYLLVVEWVKRRFYRWSGHD